MIESIAIFRTTTVYYKMEKCSLCKELYDDEELIEVKDGLIKLKTEIAKFSDVIANVLRKNNVS